MANMSASNALKMLDHLIITIKVFIVWFYWLFVTEDIHSQWLTSK